MHLASKAKLHKRNITKLTDIKNINSVKLLYMLGMYTQSSSRKFLKEVAVRFLNFQVRGPTGVLLSIANRALLTFSAIQISDSGV